jgi:hypothetical protein
MDTVEDLKRVSGLQAGRAPLLMIASGEVAALRMERPAAVRVRLFREW